MKTGHRTSFALDDETRPRLRHLSTLWKVSQAEVVRRAVRRAEEEATMRSESVRERLVEYRVEGRVTAEQADRFLDQVRQDRADWRGDAGGSA